MRQSKPRRRVPLWGERGRGGLSGREPAQVRHRLPGSGQRSHRRQADLAGAGSSRRSRWLGGCLQGAGRRVRYHKINAKGALPGPSSVTELPFLLYKSQCEGLLGSRKKDVHSAACSYARRSKNHTPSRIARKIRLDRVNSPKYCFFPCGSSRAICR